MDNINSQACKNCKHKVYCTLSIKFSNIEYSYVENKFINLCSRFIVDPDSNHIT